MIGKTLNGVRTYLIVGEGAVLIDGVDLCDLGPDGLALQNSFLLSFRKQRYLVVDVFQHDVHRRLRSQLLRPIVLQQRKNFQYSIPISINKPFTNFVR